MSISPQSSTKFITAAAAAAAMPIRRREDRCRIASHTPYSSCSSENKRPCALRTGDIFSKILKYLDIGSLARTSCIGRRSYRATRDEMTQRERIILDGEEMSQICLRMQCVYAWMCEGNQGDHRLNRITLCDGYRPYQKEVATVLTKNQESTCTAVERLKMVIIHDLSTTMAEEIIKQNQIEDYYIRLLMKDLTINKGGGDLKWFEWLFAYLPMQNREMWIEWLLRDAVKVGNISICDSLFAKDPRLEQSALTYYVLTDRLPAQHREMMYKYLVSKMPIPTPNSSCVVM